MSASQNSAWSEEGAISFSAISFCCVLRPGHGRAAISFVAWQFLASS